MYQSPLEIGPSDNQKKRIIIENNVTPLTRKITVLSGPALLVGFFVTIFLGGLNEHPFSLDHIKAFLPIACPFAFLISYKCWKAMGTKVILTDQKIIKKTPRGKERHLYWNEIKKISITTSFKPNGIYLVFSRKKLSTPFNRGNRILCPSGTLFSKTCLSEDAARLILNQIDKYKISAKRVRGFLEEIMSKSSSSLKGQARPLIPNNFGRKRVPARPSSTQRPTPK